LQKEHEQIERELLELEGIMEAGVINYPNLIHVCKKLHALWDEHERKEEIIFPILKHEQIVIPVKTMFFEHSQLALHKNALAKAIYSGSEIRVREALKKHGSFIILKLREHINLEDEVLYRITLSQFTDEEISEAERTIGKREN
jgi:DUF438 domain-containing protein